ncbi:hypothetical protein OQA88_5596 [Cercophora sp. LCS_1]
MATFKLEDIPAMMPPPGQTSNFDDPETLHSTVFGVGVATMVLMTTALGIRIFTKGFVLREMRAEEYFAIVATVGIIGWDSIFIQVSKDGFSRHLWDVRLVEVPHLSWLSYLAEITNAPTMLMAKWSILFQFRRLFCPGQVRDATFWSIHILIFLCAAYYISAIFTFTFQCIPREKTWNPLLEGHCINVSAAIMSQGAANLLLDLGILITPIWAVWNLQLTLKQKLGVSAVFGVGLLTCAIAAVGVVVRVPLLEDTDPDLTWLITKVGIWTMVEYCGTVVVGCMPTFPRFFLYITGRDQTNSTTSGSQFNSHPTRPSTKHSNAPPTDCHSPTHSRNTSGGTVRTIGMAISTSEVSFTERDIEMGDRSDQRSFASGRREPRDRQWELAMGDGDGVDRDWSPLSTPTIRS